MKDWIYEKEIIYNFSFRFQRRNRRVQEHQFHSVGRRRSGQDPTLVETLFPEYSGSHLCGGQQRQGENHRSFR